MTQAVKARPAWWRMQPSTPGELLDKFRYSYWIIWRTIQVFRQDRVQYQANALAYRSLISLVPSLAFVFSFFALFKGMTDVDLESKVREFLFRYLMPESQLADMIIGQINHFVENAKAGTYIGFVLLLITSIFLLIAIEESINQIWKVEQQRTIVQRFIIFTAVMIWGPILIGFSLFLTAQVQVHQVVERVTGASFGAQIPLMHGLVSQVLLWLHGLAGYVVPFLLVWLSLSLFYITVPNTKVESRPAIISGALAGFSWEASKWAFGYWAGYMAISREKIYASLAVFLVFLIWMYLTWIIVLFGAQLNFIIQNFRYAVRVDPKQARPVTEAYLACRLMETIAGRYERGEELPSLSDLAGRFGISIPRLRQVIAALVAGKILVRINPGPENRNLIYEIYEPNRELNQITLAHLIEAVGGNVFHQTELKGPDRFQFHDHDLENKVDAIFQQVQESNQDILGQITLKQLVEIK